LQEKIANDRITSSKYRRASANRTMVISLGFPMKFVKRSGKASDSPHVFPFNHPRQRPGATPNDDSSSLGTTSTMDDDSTSFNASSSTWDQSRSAKTIAVTFATSPNEEYANESMVKSELKELWYQPADYQLFRTMALDASQQIIATEKRNRAPHSYQRVLERTYEACCIHSASINDMMNIACDDEANHTVDDEEITSTSSTITTDSENEMNDQEFTSPQNVIKSRHSSILSADDFVHLQRWLEVGSSRIGLEKWSIRTISTSRSTRRDTIIETIMSLQQENQYDQSVKTLKLRRNVNQQEQSRKDDCAEFIRGTSERLSRPSCLFSFVMAQGLAAAVAKENLYSAI
jgi:hypothetical protein